MPIQSLWVIPNIPRRIPPLQTFQITQPALMRLVPSFLIADSVQTYPPGIRLVASCVYADYSVRIALGVFGLVNSICNFTVSIFPGVSVYS